jgi:hypothetical protein
LTAILSLLVVVTLSVLITRVAAIILTHTGMGRQAARFQARSAFSGAGFTTSESEQVVNHPVRRRVVLMLMLLGNAGIVTAVSSLILAFVRSGEGGLALELKILLLVAGLVALWALASSGAFDRCLSRLVEWLLQRYTRLDVHDYAGLLRLGGDYRIAELGVERGSWLDGRTLEEARPADEGVLVLGVSSPDGEWFGTPSGDTRFRAEDTLVVYGRAEAIEALQRRRKGPEADRDFRDAVGKQGRIAARERRQQRGELSNGR